ncbi:LOW QUALITY PROTEIN: hypothetical protein ACHAXA_011705, partial [Cyclostephanos tholiformis]
MQLPRLLSNQLFDIIYIDDANNKHMTPKVMASPTELIQHSQQAANAWGGLAIATGNSMKPEKCFAYFLTYHVNNGRHIMGAIGDLLEPSTKILQKDSSPLPAHITIPLLDDPSSPIPSLPPQTASLMLGIWFRPASRGITKMGKNGMLWTDHLSSQPLPHAATWMSFSLQLYPGMAWGIAMA